MSVDITSTESLATMIIATGALGTAAFGIVEGLKSTRLGIFGFETLKNLLGGELMMALKHAYGSSCQALMEAQYRNGRGRGTLVRTIRQGIRIGLPGADTDKLAAGLPGVDARALKSAAGAVNAGKKPTDAQRRALARFELAVDARVDAALSLAESHYVAAARWMASIIAIAAGLIVGAIVGAGSEQLGFWQSLGLGLIIGVVAVPIAPVAKDVATALRSAARALKAAP
jgi:hypothetical protein